MGEFRIGRKHARHVYPDNPRAAALGLFARNFATGPKIGDVTIAADPGTRVPWNAIDALSTSSLFTVAAGGVTVSIAGDATGLFTNGNRVIVTPTAPAAGPPVNTLTVASVPVFSAGVTTFDLSAPIDVTTTAGTIDDQTNIPITPRSTGVVLVSGVITIENGTGVTISVVVAVQVNGSSLPVPLNQQATIQNEQIVDIPFLAETTPTDTPVGVTSNIGVLLTGAGGVVLGEMSSINIQEVSVATG